MKKTLKERLLDELKQSGYIWVSARDAFVYKRRNALYELVKEGKVVYYSVSPSYIGFKLKEDL